MTTAAVVVPPEQDCDKVVLVSLEAGQFLLKPLPGRRERNMADPDDFVPSFLAGWCDGMLGPVLDPFVTPEAIALFIVLHLVRIPDRRNFLLRLSYSPVAIDALFASEQWQQMMNGAPIMPTSPSLWADIIKELECHLELSFIQGSPQLAALAAQVSRLGAPAVGAAPAYIGRAMITLALLAAMSEKGISRTLEKNQMIHSILTSEDADAAATSRRMVAPDVLRSAIASVDVTDMEEVWVQLLVATTYRRRPLFPLIFGHNAVPMLECVYAAKCEQERMRREKAARELEEARQQEEEERKRAKALEEAHRDADEAVAPAVSTQTGLRRSPSSPSSTSPIPGGEANGEVEKAYIGFDSADRDTPKMATSLDVAIESYSHTKCATGRLARLLAAGLDKEFETALNAYAAKVGLGRELPSKKMASMIVAVMGGKLGCWREINQHVSRALGRDLGECNESARAVIANLSPMAVIWMIKNLFADKFVGVFRGDLDEEVRADFSNKLSLRYQDRAKSYWDALTQYLLVQYNPRTWKSRWETRSRDDQVASEIKECLEAHPCISPELRADLIIGNLLTL